MQPILVHMSKDAQGKFSYNPVSVNLVTEIFKVIFAICTLMSVDVQRSGPPLYRSAAVFGREAYHNRLLIVPACLYAINNYLKFLMQLHFKPTTTKMLGNLKIFTIAMLMRTVLGRSFSVIQWEALFLLVCGITINQLPSCKGNGTDEPFSAIAGFYTLCSVTIPAMASVYNEFALKKHMDTSVHIQNFFLYFYGMLFNAVGLVIVTLVRGDPFDSLFAGHNTITLLLVANSAIQGILSSFFFKFADTILKKYSSALATLFTAVMSAVLFGHSLSLNFLIGVFIVLISMHQFFTFGEKKPAKNGSHLDLPNHAGNFRTSPSLEHLSTSLVSENMPKHRTILPI